MAGGGPPIPDGPPIPEPLPTLPKLPAPTPTNPLPPPPSCTVAGGDIACACTAACSKSPRGFATPMALMEPAEALAVRAAPIPPPPPAVATPTSTGPTLVEFRARAKLSRSSSWEETCGTGTEMDVERAGRVGRSPTTDDDDVSPFFPVDFFAASRNPVRYIRLSSSLCSCGKLEREGSEMSEPPPGERGGRPPPTLLLLCPTWRGLTPVRMGLSVPLPPTPPPSMVCSKCSIPSTAASSRV
mmetsp:Transcript_29962/g.64582  ORF Transcript_29962/g.64582 Transcript_29962/m.64582 type:complete len:242 (+) Transcript_29962:2337-3062(+)